jgi:hypothetical protein
MMLGDFEVTALFDGTHKFQPIRFSRAASN